MKFWIRWILPDFIYCQLAAYVSKHKALRLISRQFKEFSLMSTNPRFKCDWHDAQICLWDATNTTVFDAHYLYHTAWAARRIAQYHPKLHADFSSCLRFNSIVSAFIPVHFYDIRPPKFNLSGITSTNANLTALDIASSSIESASCMHVIEHIGLGRYGDSIDPDGDLKAFKELRRIIAHNGNLLIVVPIGGTAQIRFNAHRIYTFDMIVNEFADFKLLDFSLVKDTGEFEVNSNQTSANIQRYGCGCFHFLKG